MPEPTGPVLGMAAVTDLTVNNLSPVPTYLGANPIGYSGSFTEMKFPIIPLVM